MFQEKEIIFILFGMRVPWGRGGGEEEDWGCPTSVFPSYVQYGLK